MNFISEDDGPFKSDSETPYYYDVKNGGSYAGTVGFSLPFSVPFSKDNGVCLVGMPHFSHEYPMTKNWRVGSKRHAASYLWDGEKYKGYLRLYPYGWEESSELRDPSQNMKIVSKNEVSQSGTPFVFDTKDQQYYNCQDVGLEDGIPLQQGFDAERGVILLDDIGRISLPQEEEQVGERAATPNPQPEQEHSCVQEMEVKRPWWQCGSCSRRAAARQADSLFRAQAAQLAHADFASATGITGEVVAEPEAEAEESVGAEAEAVPKHVVVIADGNPATNGG